MKDRKTGLYYLSRLNKETQIKFCKNLTNLHMKNAQNHRISDKISGYLNHTFSTFNQFIDMAFVWKNTPEGNDFWAVIANYYPTL